MITKEDLLKLQDRLKQVKEPPKKKTKEELTQLAQEADKRRDRSRKTPTKEQKEEILLKNILEYKEREDNPVSQEEQEIPEKETSEDAWDVKIGDPIDYFDPELSYELTGYRPITKDKGLDFDPSLFTVAARHYKQDGRYTKLFPGTFAHKKHWKEEFDRCRDGITIGKYTLTGENYFWLNYYRLPSVLDKSGAELQEENFPTFLAKQYEYFHYLALCRKLGMDGVAFKSRGVKTCTPLR